MGKKLGYTWYPQDWWSSDRVFRLSLSERAIYRELIDMAYMNENKTVLEPEIWSRKYGCSVEELKRIINTLESIKDVDNEPLIILKRGIISVPSCSKRVANIEKNRKNGQSGGRKKKTTQTKTQKEPKPNQNKTQSITQSERQGEREIERENKIESEGEKKPLSPPIHPDLICSIESLKEESLKDQYYFVEHVCRQNRITPREVTIRLEAFNEHLRSIGELTKTKKDYRLHFQNWLKKQQQSKPVQTRKMREI